MPHGTDPLAAPRTDGEIIHVNERTVACDGDGPEGHPRVFLRIGGNEVVCPYCSRRYVLDAGAASTNEH
jgi:uncharacterized Zn-finger protein